MTISKENNDGAHFYSTRTVDALKNQDSMLKFLEGRAREGFTTSAYWGANGEVPPREPDDVVNRNTFRFTDELKRKLVPFPKEQTSISRMLDYTLKGFHITSKPDGSFLEPDKLMNDTQLQILKEGDANVEEGPDGFRLKPRLLNTVSTAHRLHSGFSGDVMAALHDGLNREDELQKRLSELKRKPCESTDPDGYRLTSEDYCDMSKIDPSSYRVMENKPENPDIKMEVYRSRYNNVEREGPKRREHSLQVIQNGRNVNNNTLRSTFSRKMEDDLPRGYSPYSAKEWISTTHREHATYDPAKASEMNNPNATFPLRNTNYSLSDDFQKSLTQKWERFDRRHDGAFATESSDNYQNRFNQSEVIKGHGVKKVFDIKNGVYTINHVYHHPRNDVMTNEKYTPAEIVPGQYLSMSKEPLHARNTVGRTKI
ncbi:unnamed protein product [Phytomonas sp. Hart1]|nr:unnamed protein product [Phytomonas sp. Hart1]|eukprot:CCW68731.1 unnamed protein product [Phytomonas sp. isolate Hart1]